MSSVLFSKKTFIFLTGLMLSTTSFPDSKYVYRVKVGDNISTILQQQQKKNIYGKTGALSQILRLNKKLLPSSGNLIFPGQLLILFSEVNHHLQDSQLKPKTENTLRTISSEDLIEEKTELKHEANKKESDLSAEVVKSFVKLDIDAVYFRIDSKDIDNNTQGDFLSKLSQRMNLDWQVIWEKYSFFLGLQQVSEYIYPNRNSQLEIKNRSGQRSTIYTGFGCNFDQSKSISLFLGLTERLFAYGLSSESIALSRVNVPFLSLEHSFVLSEKKNAQLGLKASVTYFGESEGEGVVVVPGYGYELTGFLQQKFKHFTLQGKVFADRSFQDTEATQNEQKTIGVGMSFIKEIEE